jgi:hypothetical protein
MVQILHKRAAQPATDESHITEVRWYEPESGNINVATTATMVEWLRDKKGRAYVCNGLVVADVEAVEGATPYIRVKPGPGVTVSLLNLPDF